MTDSFWQYAVAPLAVALGGGMTLLWQSLAKRREAAADAEQQRDHDDLVELRTYRARIDDELQKCRSSEQSMMLQLADLRTGNATLAAKVESLTEDLAQALAAITKATDRIDTLEADNASLEMTVRVIGTDRDALKARIDIIELDRAERRAGQKRTRASDKNVG